MLLGLLARRLSCKFVFGGRSLGISNTAVAARGRPVNHRRFQGAMASSSGTPDSGERKKKGGEGLKEVSKL